MSTKIIVRFERPIIDGAKPGTRLVSAWEPDTTGWVSAPDDALVIFGSPRFSLIEKWLSIWPIVGPVFISTLFETIHQKQRPVAYGSVVRLVAANRPKRSSMWDGGAIEAVILHVFLEERAGRPEICAFSTDLSRNTPGDVMAFWASCVARLGTDKVEIRDEAARRALQFIASKDDKSIGSNRVGAISTKEGALEAVTPPPLGEQRLPPPLPSEQRPPPLLHQETPAKDSGNKTVGEVMVAFMLQHEEELRKTEMSGLVALDLMRGIINSNFSEEALRKALQYPNFKIRTLMEKFVAEFGNR
jgi:hypothetical protein